MVARDKATKSDHLLIVSRARSNLARWQRLLDEHASVGRAHVARCEIDDGQELARFASTRGLQFNRCCVASYAASPTKGFGSMTSQGSRRVASTFPRMEFGRQEHVVLRRSR
jgi:hypothetical protein